jgi:N-formylglutamate amidohydrolase
MSSYWKIMQGDGPLITTAIHAGHLLHPRALDNMVVPETHRLYEEDPFTDLLAKSCSSNVIVSLSRFCVDLDRPREKAVYLSPEDAWGLNVWRQRPRQPFITTMVDIHQAFFKDLKSLINEKVVQHGRCVVLDLHSYNHRRLGPDAQPDSDHKNPEINIGTEHLDKNIWGGTLDRFVEAMKGCPGSEGLTDVRENVKTGGGHLSQWVNLNWPGTVFCLTLEFRKSFMDEWSGKLDPEAFERLQRILDSGMKSILSDISD